MPDIWLSKVDITEISIDAVVCAANAGLVLGCGVAGSIWRRGGQSIQDECDRIGKVEPGEVAVTTAGNLPATYVFHAVSMGYQHPNVGELLHGVTTKCLAKASELGLSSIAFPAIASGRMKLAPERSCEHMGQALADFDFSGSSLQSVGFALLDEEVFDVFTAMLPEILKGRSDLELSFKSPPTIAMPWRSF